MLISGRFYQWISACPTPAAFREREDAIFSAGGPDDPRLQCAELLVRNPLEGVTQLVPRQAQEPTLRVHVFRLHRQVGDVADLLFIDHLSPFVVGGLEDASRPVDAAPGQTCPA